MSSASSKVFVKQASHGGLEIQSDSHGDTMTLLPSALSRILGVAMVDMTEDTPLLVLYHDGGDQSLEIPFSSRTNVRRAYDQVLALLTKSSA